MAVLTAREKLAEQLPPILWRSDFNDLAKTFGLPFGKRSMEARDAAGTGPKVFKFNQRLGYHIDDYLDWLASIGFFAIMEGRRG